MVLKKKHNSGGDLASVYITNKAFNILRQRKKAAKAKSNFILPVFCRQPCTCPPVWVRLHHHAPAGERKSAAAFCFILTPAPGYSKLQIAADNIARYWNMFDLLTHTHRSPPVVPPAFFPSPPPPPPPPTPTPKARHGAPTVTCLQSMKSNGPC